MKDTIKKSVIGALTFSLTLMIIGITYASISTVSSGDSLTAEMWNNLISTISDNEEKLVNVTSGGTGLFVTGNVNAKNTVKAYASFNGEGGITIYDSYGVSSIVRKSAGYYTITWNTEFINDFYIVQGVCNMLGTGGTKFGLEGNNIDGDMYNNITTTSADVGCRNSSNEGSDADLIHITVYGEQ